MVVRTGVTSATVAELDRDILLDREGSLITSEIKYNGTGFTRGSKHLYSSSESSGDGDGT